MEPLDVTRDSSFVTIDLGSAGTVVTSTGLVTAEEDVVVGASGRVLTGAWVSGTTEDVCSSEGFVQTFETNLHRNGMAFVTNIARDQTGNPHHGFFQRDSARPADWTPCVSATTGQSEAPYTAETYAYFGILS